MNIFNKAIPCMLITVVFSSFAWANDTEQGDIFLSGYVPIRLQPIKKINLFKSVSDYTVLDATQYRENVNDARIKVQMLLNTLQTYQYQDANARIAFIAQQLSDIPYIFSGAMGEGDWQPTASIYQPGAVHIKQDPVYRFDGLNCQTFVQVAMGLLYSKDLNEFDQNYIKISYGAAGNPLNETIHYFNRNNFVDGDWNPVNQRNGWLRDVTSQSSLATYAETTSAIITRQNWFLFQQKDLSANVRVLADADGSSMAKRFMTTYSVLQYPHFDAENVSIAYIPKEKIALQQSDGSYQPNQSLIDKIPTPAVMEIVRDVKKWFIGGKNIKDIIGSELSISHMGLLYRQSFQYGDLIYRKTTCSYDVQHQKICTVTPVICQKNQCNELMFAHATDARPNGYYWYKQADGNYTCSAQLPAKNITYTQCNRVEQQPLFAYLTEYQYGSYWYMNNPAILGVHIEQLS